jgi:hypothetical protein
LAALIERTLQSVAISGNQWQSVAISGNQWQSVAISGNFRTHEDDVAITASRGDAHAALDHAHIVLRAHEVRKDGCL